MKTSILFDKKTNKITRIIMIISGICSIIYLALLVLPERITDNLESLIVSVVLVGNAMFPVFLISFFVYINSAIYLKRLENNTFKVPDKKSDYNNNLENLPRTEIVENRYANDSNIAFYISLVVYIIFLVLDIIYLITWNKYEKGAMALFIALIIGHFIYMVIGLLLRRQRNTDEYVDDVDIRNGKKTRMSLVRFITLLLVLGLLGAFSVATAHTMTRYIYKSRNGSYDKTIDYFKSKATMSVTSPNLKDGVWDSVITNTDAGSNMSPEISFDRVEGAKYYVVYMVDESANNWVHWIVTNVDETTLPLGANKDKYAEDNNFKYIGPYPPAGSGNHTYTIYVYAMKDKPDSSTEYQFDEPFLTGMDMYYSRLNISKYGKINEYGNVLAYGYISGTYSR